MSATGRGEKPGGHPPKRDFRSGSGRDCRRKRPPSKNRTCTRCREQVPPCLEDFREVRRLQVCSSVTARDEWDDAQLISKPDAGMQDPGASPAPKREFHDTALDFADGAAV